MSVYEAPFHLQNVKHILTPVGLISSRFCTKGNSWPWLVWLSGLSAALQTKGSPVRFPVGHKHGFWARSPVGGTQEATTH